jgi:two-component system response regulator NreC
MIKNKINLLMIEDHHLIREGVKLMLNDEEEYTFDFTEVTSGEEALEILKIQNFDVILLDISLKKLNGLEILAILRKNKTFKTPVIFQTMHLDNFTVEESFKLKANGYLLKIEDPHVLMRAIATVLDGGTFYSESIYEFLNKRLKFDKKQSELNELNKLSEREEEVLRLSAEGFTCKDIGEKLKISTRTVEGHRHRIFVKLDIDSVAKLIIYATKNGYV